MTDIYDEYAKKVNAASVLAKGGDSESQSFLKRQFQLTVRGTQRRVLLEKAFEKWDYTLYNRLFREETDRLQKELKEAQDTMQVVGVIIGIIISPVFWAAVSDEPMGDISVILLAIAGAIGGGYAASWGKKRFLDIENHQFEDCFKVGALASLGGVLGAPAFVLGIVLLILALVLMFI